jgi:hypothetical protein
MRLTIVVEQDVGGLQVAVQNASLMRMMDRPRHWPSPRLVDTKLRV